MALRELAELRALAAELRDEFITLADELDMHLRNVNIARVSGGVVGVVGGVIATAGPIAAPFTFGASAIIAGVAGLVVASAGGVTVAGAQVAKEFIENSKCKGVSEKWDNFRSRAIQFCDQNRAFVETDAQSLFNFVRIGFSTYQLASRVIKAASTGVGIAAGRAVGQVGLRTVAGSALSVVGVGVSVYDIVSGAIDIHKKKKSKAGDVIRELARELDKIAKE